MQPNEYTVKLDKIFEGPMDLLIHLIRKNEVDVYDIPVGLITEQYLVYLEWIKLLDIDNVGDFLLMASTLAHIKSRMLLPIHDGETEEEDPRLEIARPLSEYLHAKSVADELSQRNMLGDKIFTRRPNLKNFLKDDQDVIQVGLFELIDAFQKILNKIAQDHTVDLASDRISIKDRINAIISILEEKGSITFTELFDGACEKSFIIVTFLALLELMKLSLVHVVQNTQNGVIRLFYQ